MANSSFEQEPAPRPAAGPSLIQFVVTRRVIVLLACLLIGPWGVVLVAVAGKPAWRAIVALWPASPDDDDIDSASPPQVVERKPGPWGQLQYTRIAIELPEEFVFVPPHDSKPIRWFFKGSNKDQVLQFMQQSGLNAKQMEALKDAKFELALSGCWLTPPEDLIVNMAPEVRSKVYTALVQYPENRPHIDPFCYRASLLDERFAGSGLSDSSLSLFKQFLYPGPQQLVLFADMETALRQIKTDAERRQFVKTVSRRLTLLVKLRITPETNIEEVVSYWSVGGRSKDLRPLLDSLSRVDGGCMIEIVHLLPRFIRERLFSYPFASEETEGVKHDCFWTAFNTFSDSPDDRFSDMNYAAKVLQQQYYGILKPSQLGDLVFLATQDGAAVHAATYIADDIVFTKNGATYIQPWILMRMNYMLDLYSVTQPPDKPLKVLYYRRKSM